MSEAVKRELSQVESIIKDLSPASYETEQPTVENDRTIEELRNQNLQLELDLTRAKLEATARFTAAQCLQDGSGKHNSNL